MPLCADVAVPVPLARPFTYEVPADLAGSVRPGSRVLCAFAGRKLLGVVLHVSEREAPADFALKPIGALVDPEPVLPDELLAFLQELSRYYLAPIGEVLRLALPAVEREQARALSASGEVAAGLGKIVGRREIQVARPTSAVETPGSLRGQAAAILALLRASGEEPVARLSERWKNARQALKKLAALGLCTVEAKEAPADPFFAESMARDVPPVLNEAQAAAAARIEAALDRVSGKASRPPGDEGGEAERSTSNGFLLFGVTGSGKTEVYLRAIEASNARGRGALMMVPEIALTPQLVGRFRARFGDDVAVLHSGLSERDRHAMWQRLRRGEVRVAIGARSALFAPVPDLGLIIVDEEHDPSFKQEEGVRYHARDMAILRAHRAHAVVVLGSATPSLEAFHLTRTGKLGLLSLPDRAHREATLPTVTVIDLRRIGAGPSGQKLLSLPLHRAIDETLAQGEQTILFLNRRGFAPSVVCEACGAVETCQSCSVALTFHRTRGGRVRCHYCDYEAPLPDRCSACGGAAQALEGLGTERLEAAVAESFPRARVARLDRDVAEGARAEAILDRVRRGEIDILVGTQMVTKGHDLPNVTLVGVVNADAPLSMPDFRASERGFSLLVQVAGRAGRRDRPGRVLVQTRTPEHAAIAFAARHDVPGFLERELADRREVHYPPFSRLALLRVDAVDEEAARQAAALLAAHARASPVAQDRTVQVLGPAAAPIARLRGRYRFRVLLRSAARPALRAAVLAALEGRAKNARDVRVTVDMDPVAML